MSLKRKGLNAPDYLSKEEFERIVIEENLNFVDGWDYFKIFPSILSGKKYKTAFKIGPFEDLIRFSVYEDIESNTVFLVRG